MAGAAVRVMAVPGAYDCVHVPGHDTPEPVTVPDRRTVAVSVTLATNVAVTAVLAVMVT